MANSPCLRVCIIRYYHLTSRSTKVARRRAEGGRLEKEARTTYIAMGGLCKERFRRNGRGMGNLALLIYQYSLYNVLFQVH